jgi:hypothetical protein
MRLWELTLMVHIANNEVYTIRIWRGLSPFSKEITEEENVPFFLAVSELKSRKGHQKLGHILELGPPLWSTFFS